MTRLRAIAATIAAAALALTLAPHAAQAEPRPDDTYEYMITDSCWFEDESAGTYITVDVVFRSVRDGYYAKPLRVSVHSSADVPSTMYLHERKRDRDGNWSVRSIPRNWNIKAQATTNVKPKGTKALPVGSYLIVQVWSPEYGTCQADIINTNM